MIRHITDKELELLVNGSYSTREIFDASRHIAQCIDCKERLRKKDPIFINQAEEFFTTEEETDLSHISEADIKDFLEMRLPLQTRLEISEHVRSCAKCKQLMYKQDPFLLKKSISVYLNKEEGLEKKPFFSNLGMLVPVGSLAILALCISAFLILSISRQDGTDVVYKAADDPSFISSDQAATSDNTKAENTLPDFGKKEELSNQAVKATVPVSKDNVRPTKARTIAPAIQNKSKDVADIKKIQKKPNIISESRSGIVNPACANSEELSVTMRSNAAYTEFNWNPVNKASKYNVFLSDTSQNLVEESEVPANTTNYLTKIKLEKDKKYKVIVTATLSKDEVIVSRPVFFQNGKQLNNNKQTGNIPSRNSNIRCKTKPKFEGNIKPVNN